MSYCPDSEFSQKFVDAMRNAMAVSFLKYGAVADAYPHKVDALKSLRLRLRRYEETGNGDFLVDAANMAMIEFMRPSHPDYHYTPGDSRESPGRVWQDGRQRTLDNAGERT